MTDMGTGETAVREWQLEFCRRLNGLVIEGTAWEEEKKSQEVYTGKR